MTKLHFNQAVKNYILQFADLYHRYKVESESLRSIRYRIHSSLADYKKTKKLQLSITDKPGDLLPPLTIQEIKNSTDIISGLHPIDVNSINDLFYLSQDKVVEVRVQDHIIQAINQDGTVVEYNINETFDHGNIASKRIAFMIGYMQAEIMMRKAYSHQEKYRVLQDNITTLNVLNTQNQDQILMNPMDILFSNDYKYFSKEDIARIGFICGEMSRAAAYSNDIII